MSTSGSFVIMFCVATAIALLVRRVRVPYTVALVIAGLLIGGIEIVDPPRLTRELLFTVFLPGLLFEAAFHLDLDALRSMWRSILALAVPGVALSVAITAVVVKAGAIVGLASGIDWQTAILFGAVV